MQKDHQDDYYTGLPKIVQQAFAAAKSGNKAKFDKLWADAKKIYVGSWQKTDKDDHNLDAVSVDDWFAEASDFLNNKPGFTRENMIGFYYEWLTDEDWHKHINE